MGRAGRLPNFLVIGAGKAGTTSLHHYLGQHPQVFACPVKEPKFFALAGSALDYRGPGDERIRAETAVTLDDYLALFAGARDEHAVGESSTLYLSHEAAPAAIARLVPEVRLIAILRDPAERAHSNFLHLRRDGYEPLADFGAALAAERDRAAAGWYYAWLYRDRGFYHRDLSRYFELFDRSRIRVYLHEELDREPLRVLDDIFGFLGVDRGFRPDVRARHNVSGRPRSGGFHRALRRSRRLRQAAKLVVPDRLGHRAFAAVHRANLERRPMPPGIRADLVAGYADDIRRLEGLIDRDLSSWLRA